MTGSWCTGKATELAMKHIRLASSCSAAAFSAMSAVATVMAGRSVTALKRPEPSAASSIVPMALST